MNRSSLATVAIIGLGAALAPAASALPLYQQRNPYSSIHLFTRNEGNVVKQELVARDLVFKAGLEGLGEMARNAGVPDNMAHLVRGATRRVDHPVPLIVGPFAAPTVALGAARVNQDQLAVQGARVLQGEIMIPEGVPTPNHLANFAANAALNAPHVRVATRPLTRGSGANQRALRIGGAEHTNALPPVNPTVVRQRINLQGLLHLPPQPPSMPRAASPRPPTRAPMSQYSSRTSNVDTHSSSSTSNRSRAGSLRVPWAQERNASSNSRSRPDMGPLTRSGTSTSTSTSDKGKGKAVLEEPISSHSRLIVLPSTALHLGPPGSSIGMVGRRRPREEFLNDGLDLELATPSSKLHRQE